MHPERTIACSLDGAQMNDRLADMAAVGEAGLLDVARDGDGYVLHFREDPATGARLEEIVKAEAQCCAFLDLDLQRQAGGVSLTIRGPEEATPLVEDLVAAFRRRVSA